MDTMTFKDVRGNFASVMDKVALNHETVIVTRQQRAINEKESKTIKIVMISLDEYNDLQSCKETAYLFGSNANAKALIESFEQAERGETIAMDYDEWKKEAKNVLSKKLKKAA